MTTYSAVLNVYYLLNCGSLIYSGLLVGGHDAHYVELDWFSVTIKIIWRLVRTK